MCSRRPYRPGLSLIGWNQVSPSVALTDPAGHLLRRHGAVCLETQHLPDAPNRPAYPSPVLRPGTTGHRRTEFRFPRPAPPTPTAG